MTRKAIFIAATGQNVGKTTICLGLIAALRKHFPKLGFMKPVGQQHLKVGNDLLVDKDVVLFKEYFNLPAPYADMSPVIFPRGFTRNYLNGHVSSEEMLAKISQSYQKISSENDFTIVEGTGHVGVGSIAHLNNALVAKSQDLEVVIIAKGGLGSAFDELAINKAMCDAHGVKVRGVILNRVLNEKREMICSYMRKALNRWKIPLIGAIPFSPFLNTAAMADFETLFKTSLLSGEAYHNRHFESIRLVATSLSTFMELTYPNQLIVTPASREDIIYALLERCDVEQPQYGLIMTGRHAPSEAMVEKLRAAQLPALYTALATFDTMKMISQFTAKTRKEDTLKVERTIELVEENLDISHLVA